MRRYLSTLLLGTVLMAPAAIMAQEHEHHDQRNHDQRYYDPYEHRYHEWNEGEQRAYRHWLEEQHREYHDWAKANSRERRDYWKWRHEHPNWEENRH